MKPARGLDLDVFNDAPPYRLKIRLTRAAESLGMTLLPDGWLRLESLAQAERLAARVTADLRRHAPDATFRVTGAVLWELCGVTE